MTIPYSNKVPIRIPNLPFGQLIDDKGFPTDDFLTFMQALVGNLENFIGNEGLVMPTQSSQNITEIANNVDENQRKTLAFGTLIYDADNRKILASIDDGTGNPIFKEVNLI